MPSATAGVPSHAAAPAAARRGAASGFIFMGVGLGIAASGTLVPLLLRQGLTQAWLGLGALPMTKQTPICLGACLNEAQEPGMSSSGASMSFTGGTSPASNHKRLASS
jgi:hypothetical protein